MIQHTRQTIFDGLSIDLKMFYIMTFWNTWLYSQSCEKIRECLKTSRQKGKKSSVFCRICLAIQWSNWRIKTVKLTIPLDQCCPTLSPFATCGDRAILKIWFILKKIPFINIFLSCGDSQVSVATNMATKKYLVWFYCTCWCDKLNFFFASVSLPISLKVYSFFYLVYITVTVLLTHIKTDTSVKITPRGFCNSLALTFPYGEF